MGRFSKKIFTFVRRFNIESQHRGELLSLCPSENLENSRSMDTGLKVVPPVRYIYAHSSNVANEYSFGCGLNFILYATGIPEPSDKDCLKAHTLCPLA